MNDVLHIKQERAVAPKIETHTIYLNQIFMTVYLKFSYVRANQNVNFTQLNCDLDCFNLCVCDGADTALADIALNILCLLMKDRWSWLCTENIHKTIRLLFGTFIER